MSFRTSLKSLIRRDASTPSLRERAASLRASVSARTVRPRPLPAPGSEEAKAAFLSACREHSIRTNPPGGWPDLTREGERIWTRHDLGKAMDTGEITPFEYARLYPLASERELQIETVGHDLNLGSLFALAYADEYPLKLLEPEPEDRAAQTAPIATSLVDQIDFASASLEDLRSLHDVADLVSDVAYATVWTARCKARGRGDDPNAAGKLMQWLGDALTDVETAAHNEARRRTPSHPMDRETRLQILALPTIQDGSTDETEALARELLAWVQSEREDR
jgi:hypothetical protein